MSLHSKETHEFVKLLTGHQAALRAFIVSLIPSSPDVQDVLQDTNVVIWEKMDKYKSGSNFRAWTFTIARNTVKAQLRKTKQYQGTALNEDVILAITETWYHRQEQNIDRKQLALDQCLLALKQAERNLVNARYTQGASLEKHAQKIGRTAESLRVTLFRIRIKLRECVRHRIQMEGGVS